jgi:hypothetical protein
MPSTMRPKANLHVAIIMDGNGRWPVRRHLPRTAGHRAGVRAMCAIAEAAPELGISILTLFAFSSDNWKRPAPEVNHLIWLLQGYLRSDAHRFVESGASSSRDRTARPAFRPLTPRDRARRARYRSWTEVRPADRRRLFLPRIDNPRCDEMRSGLARRARAVRGSHRCIQRGRGAPEPASAAEVDLSFAPVANGSPPTSCSGSRRMPN